MTGHCCSGGCGRIPVTWPAPQALGPASNQDSAVRCVHIAVLGEGSGLQRVRESQATLHRGALGAPWGEGHHGVYKI